MKTHSTHKLMKDDNSFNNSKLTINLTKDKLESKTLSRPKISISITRFSNSSVNTPFVKYNLANSIGSLRL
jgi:hypothetical protein